MLAEISRRLPSAPPPPNLGFAREPALADPRDNVFQTRVGPRWIDPALVIDMPGGLAGFPALRSFAGIQLERARFGPLNLLQSLEDPRVAFLVFPDAPGASLYVHAHVLAACADEGFEPAATAVLVIANARAESGVTLNLRAPILLETRRRTAAQHIIAEGEYPIRHVP
jgi:flagellar assembly factor FliW